MRRRTVSIGSVLPCLLLGLAVAAGVAVAVPGGAGGASAPAISGPFQPYFPPPFAGQCTVHEFGEAVIPTLRATRDDPLCVEYAKRDITIANGGAIRFLIAEPSRVLVALNKCQYWQQDHWSVQLMRGSTAIVRWDGSYWWDLGAGQAGARLANLTLAGQPIGATQLADLLQPLSPTLAGYFRAYGQGGTGAGWAGTVAFNPLCAN